MRGFDEGWGESCLVAWVTWWNSVGRGFRDVLVYLYIYISVYLRMREKNKISLMRETETETETQLTAISHCLARPIVQHVAGGRAEERVGVRPEVGRELGGCGGGGEGRGEGRDALGLTVNDLSVCAYISDV